MFGYIYDVNKFLVMPAVHHAAMFPTNHQKIAEHRKHINMLALKGVLMRDKEGMRGVR